MTDPRAPLTAAQIQAELTGSAWTLEGDIAITRSFRFKSFLEAIAFIQRIAPIAEEMDHHPELFNVYDRVDIRLTTHDAGGLTALDFTLSSRIDQIATNS